MNIAHLNLTVDDVIAMRAFFVDHFEIVPVGATPSPRIAILHDAAGFTFTLMANESDGPAQYPGAFHIGFVLESAEAVDRQRQRLIDAGYAIAPAQRSHGAYTCYVHGPEDLLIEICTYAPALP